MAMASSSQSVKLPEGIRQCMRWSSTIRIKIKSQHSDTLIPMAGHIECPEPLLHIPALNRLVLWHFSASSENNMLYKDV